MHTLAQSSANLARWLLALPIVAAMAVPALIDHLWWKLTGRTLWPAPRWFVRLVRWTRQT